MDNFKIYAHDKTDPESDLIYICSCENECFAKFLKEAIELKFKGGYPKNVSGYDLYIKDVKEKII